MRWANELIDYASKSYLLDLFVSGRPQQYPANCPTLSNGVEKCEGDSRHHPRSNVALAAELHYDSKPISVTIANLSRGGAMVKGSPLLEPGACVHLLRGKLCSEATVIWGSGSGCGLAFANEIQVGEWVLPLTNIGQRRINQIVAFVKADNPPSAATPLAGRSPPELRNQPQWMSDVAIVIALLTDLAVDLASSADTVGRHCEDLKHLDAAIVMLSNKRLQRCSRHQFVECLGEPFDLLGRLEDEITCCVETLARHGYKLQHLDLAMQMLEEIAAGSLIGDGGALSGSTRLPRLRIACEQALGPK